MKFLKIYLSTIVSFFILDLFWLGFAAKDLYQDQIGFLLSEKINWYAPICFYLLYVLALDFFVIYPSLNKNLLKNAFLPGAFFGFVCYATYDLTNLATIHGWPLKIVVIDLLWGAVVTGVVSLASCWLNSERKKNKFLFWK